MLSWQPVAIFLKMGNFVQECRLHFWTYDMPQNSRGSAGNPFHTLHYFLLFVPSHSIRCCKLEHA